MTINNTKRYWMWLLWLAWTVFLFGGLLFGEMNEAETHTMPLFMRIMSSFTLFVAGWAWWWLMSGDDRRSLAFFIAMGMTFGFIGDLFMADLIISGDNSTLGGIGSFGVGHVFYIVGLVRFGNKFGLDDKNKRQKALKTCLAIGAVAWFVIVLLGADERSIIHFIALPYALLLSGTFGVACGLAWQKPIFAITALGAGLFLFSDLLLAANLFNDFHFRGIGDVVWLTYGPGQMLIVFTMAFGKRFKQI